MCTQRFLSHVCTLSGLQCKANVLGDSGRTREENYWYIVQLRLMKRYIADEYKVINVSMTPDY